MVVKPHTRPLLPAPNLSPAETGPRDGGRRVLPQPAAAVWAKVSRCSRGSCLDTLRKSAQSDWPRGDGLFSAFLFEEGVSDKACALLAHSWECLARPFLVSEEVAEGVCTPRLANRCCTYARRHTCSHAHTYALTREHVHTCTHAPTVSPPRRCPRCLCGTEP